MASTGFGHVGGLLIGAAQQRERRTWHLPRVLTTSNMAAVVVVLLVSAAFLTTVAPYRIINTSEVCNHCGAYQYTSTRQLCGVPLASNRLFVRTLSSRLYQRLVAAEHPHRWILSGECRGSGNLLDQADVVIIKGNGPARAEQIEQSLLALQEAAGFAAQ